MWCVPIFLFDLEKSTWYFLSPLNFHLNGPTSSYFEYTTALLSTTANFGSVEIHFTASENNINERVLTSPINSGHFFLSLGYYNYIISNNENKIKLKFEMPERLKLVNSAVSQLLSESETLQWTSSVILKWSIVNPSDPILSCTHANSEVNTNIRLNVSVYS